MRVFYNSDMSVDSLGYSPSASKPKAVVEDWTAHNLDVEIKDFRPAKVIDFNRAHSEHYVRGVLGCTLDNGHGNRSRRVAESFQWTVGSIIAASRQALIHGITCSPTSGFHHAGWSHGGGYCTFNGLVIAARTMLDAGEVSRIGIIDFDNHYGDGTDNIICRLNMVDIDHWSFGAPRIRRGSNLAKIFRSMQGKLRTMHDSGVKLVLYQAGADPHKDDPLGGWLTNKDLSERDRIVFETCRRLKMSVCWNLAGGYQREKDGSIPKVLEIHRNTAITAIDQLRQYTASQRLSA